MKIDDIKAFLSTYHNFDDCVLLGFEWRDLGHTLDCHINNIYRPDGLVRDHLEVEQRGTLRFKTVHEFRFANGFTQYQLEHLEEIEWSSNIFSQMKLETESELLANYKHLRLKAHHLSIRWERKEKRMDIVFSDLEYFWKTPQII